MPSIWSMKSRTETRIARQSLISLITNEENLKILYLINHIAVAESIEGAWVNIEMKSLENSYSLTFVENMTW